MAIHVEMSNSFGALVSAVGSLVILVIVAAIFIRYVPSYHEMLSPAITVLQNSSMISNSTAGFASSALSGADLLDNLGTVVGIMLAIGAVIGAIIVIIAGKLGAYSATSRSGF
jgi:hypothetical protein